MIPTCDCGENLSLDADGYACLHCAEMFCEDCGAEPLENGSICENCWFDVPPYEWWELRTMNLQGEVLVDLPELPDTIGDSDE